MFSNLVEFDLKKASAPEAFFMFVLNMKKLLSLIALLCVVYIASAQQNPDNPYKQIGSISLGNALAARTLLVADTGQISERQASPVLGFLYDYQVGEKFSLGANLSFQTFTVTVRDSLSNFMLEQARVNRIYLGLRGVFNLDNKDNFDIYTGFKVGYIVFNTGPVSGPNASNSNIESMLNNSRPSLGFIPLGLRWYVTEQLGIMFESSLGVPTFLSAGLSYRLH